MAPPRILLCGDVLGRLNQLFKRVFTVNKSAGPFDALFCVGQFFPDAPELLEEFMDFVEGRSQVPLPTYFIGDYGIGAIKVLSAASRNHSSLGFKMDGLKICDNLYWLKGSGKFKLHGLSVAYLSGRQSAEGQVHGTYSQDDVDSLRALAEEPGIVDFFLSNEWPSGVTNRVTTDIPPGISEFQGTDSTIAELVTEVKPRYHIAGTTGVFYDRQPYLNTDALHVTRFIGLAPVGSKDKQKFIHAVSPIPASSMSSFDISTKPSNTTLSPYTYVEPKSSLNESGKRASDDSDSQFWRYDVSQKRQRSGTGDGDRLCFKFLSSGSCPRGEKCNFRHDDEAREQYRGGVCFDFLNKGKCERGPDCSFKHSLQKEGENRPHSGSNTKNDRSKECWFCLSSPSVESHLIVSIGETYYCALAKGPLVPDHVLIIPVEHSPNTLLSPAEHESELNKFQNSLKRYHAKQNKEVVFFEWVSKRGTHANLQAVPVPSSRAKSLQSIFNLAADKLGFKFVVTKSDGGNGRNFLRSQFDYRQSMFYVELPDGTILSHLVDENERFPAQFGREVVSGLLDMADKADWRSCALSKEEEAKTVQDFKTRFDEFDPNRS